MPGRHSDNISTQIVYTATWEIPLEMLRQYNLFIIATRIFNSYSFNDSK
jgi:hypothetical protein